MNIIIFVFGMCLIIFLEAVTDSLTYVGWKDSDKKAAGFSHVFQIITILSGGGLGIILASIGVNFSWVNMGLMILTAAFWHELLFDRFYNLLLDKTGIGETSFRDRLWRMIGINPGSLVYNVVVLVLTFVLTILLSTKIA
jgi:hypothetical protein